MGSVFRWKFSAGLALALSGLAVFASAQVVSASLEYSCTSPVKFMLNGVEIKNPESADGHLTDYALISSVDGAFPLGLLKYGEPNVLAVLQKNLMRSLNEQYMMLSYCLTLRYATGEQLRVVSKPSEVRSLFLPINKPAPAGWLAAGFDDSAWKRPIRMYLEGQAFSFGELPDPEFGTVPHLARDFTSRGQMGDSLCFRQNFKLPSRPGALRVYPYQVKPKRGDKPAFAVIPDRGCAAIGDLQVSVQLPQGLDPLAAPGMQWDAGARKMSWRYPSPAKFTALHLASVVENQGFEGPQVALGPWRTDRAFRNKQALGEDYWHSTAINSGTSAWYKLSAPPVFVDGPAAPVIVGVVFQSQIVPGGWKGALAGEGVDDILLNYSVDGSAQGALKKAANLTRFGGAVPEGGGGRASSSVNTWVNGYYVADTDRNWTWKDLANLRVQLSSVQHGQRHRSQLLSCIASVRYYQPSDITPRFYAQTTEAARKTLRLTAEARSTQGDAAAVGYLDLNVNQ